MSTVTNYGMPVKAQLKALQNTPILRDYGFIPYPQDRGHIVSDVGNPKQYFARYKSWSNRYWSDDVPENYDDVYYVKSWLDKYHIIRKNRCGDWDDLIAFRGGEEENSSNDLYVPISDKIGDKYVVSYVIFKADSFKITVKKAMGIFPDGEVWYHYEKDFTRAINALRYIRGE